MSRPLLEIRDLVVEFRRGRSMFRAVAGVDLDVFPGESLGVVGRSGAGKTVALLGALRLLPASAQVRGHARFDGADLLTMPSATLRRLRGREIGAVFQDPMTSLHPAFRVGDQVAEAVRVHAPGMSTPAVRGRVIDLLGRVGIPAPDRRLRDYPHQWSGGMRQRAMIAMAIAHSPRLIVADEPTTALDVTVQAQILDLLRSVRVEFGSAVVLVTHDLGVVAEIADRVAVFSEGRIVETAAVGELFRSPAHPATVHLLSAVPGRQPARTTSPGTPEPILQAVDLATHYRAASSMVHAVDGVTLTLHAGETLAVVGESGCGKSTLARTLLRLVDPVAGRLLIDGQDITALSGRDLTQLRRGVSMVFQDPYGSLNPRRSVGDAIADPLRIVGRYRAVGGARRVGELLAMVGLDATAARRLPAEFSGGQRQRIAIARALALEPRALVLDEPLSSLDASSAAEVVELLQRLQRELQVAYLFISHDLRLVQRIATRVAVMYAGVIVEEGPAADVYGAPRHPYTRELLAAVPVLNPAERRPRPLPPAGDVPELAASAGGCRFVGRCPAVESRCRSGEPPLMAKGGDVLVRCVVTDGGSRA